MTRPIAKIWMWMVYFVKMFSLTLRKTTTIFHMKNTIGHIAYLTRLVGWIGGGETNFDLALFVRESF